MKKKLKSGVIAFKQDEICPLEVKSSGCKTHPSLDLFARKYSSGTVEKYLIDSKDYYRDGDVRCLPVYDVMFL